MLFQPSTNLEGLASFFGLLSFCVWGRVSDYTEEALEFSNQQLVRQPGDQRNRSWERSIYGRNSKLANDFCVERGGLYVRCWGLLHEYRDVPKMLAGLTCLFEGLRRARTLTAAQGTGLCWAVPLNTDAQLEAGARVRELEEELMLEKDCWVSTTLLASGWKTRWENRIINWR